MRGSNFLVDKKACGVCSLLSNQHLNHQRFNSINCQFLQVWKVSWSDEATKHAKSSENAKHGFEFVYTMFSMCFLIEVMYVNSFGQLGLKLFQLLVSMSRIWVLTQLIASDPMQSRLIVRLNPAHYKLFTPHSFKSCVMM